ncbi:hypothetical protein K6W21_01470 [Burkholderia latens]|uniref:hypothetical protein n=1 Tax=Burkholderia latens TaxID=488446 RepID=UPI001C9545C7|nr:hypothetical protein [Burkholderia latens]MBY4692757.1 hypothetical protein [Burkholderia latens]
MAGIVITSITSAAIVTGIGYLFRDWFAANVKARVEHDYNARLESIKKDNAIEVEKLRSQLTHQASMLSLAHKSLSDYAQPFNQRRLTSLGELWQHFVTARAITPPVIVARWDILLPSEYSDGLAKRTLFEITQEEVIDRIKATDSAENIRPFVGEDLWAYFFTFRAVMGRIGHLYVEGYKKRLLTPWYDDTSIKAMLATLFNESEIADLEKNHIGKLRAVQQMASAKFAKAIQEAASGQRDSEAQLLRAGSMTEAAVRAQRETDFMYQSNDSVSESKR